MLGSLSPGIDTIDDTTNVVTTDHFDYPVVMERMRGQIFHAMDNGGNQSNFPSDPVPFSVAMFIVPSELARAIDDADMPNLFANADGDNYPLYFSHMCDARGSSIPPLDLVDVKSKRVVDVGSQLVIGATAKIPSAFGTSVDLQFALNLSILWRRKS